MSTQQGTLFGAVEHPPDVVPHEINHRGSVKGKSLVFIGVPDSMHEKLKTPLTERTVHTFTMSVEDASWLAWALQKEVRRHEQESSK